MSQSEFRVDLFVYADGTLAVHGGDIRGLVMETDDIRELRSELYRIAPRLLSTNHGLSRKEIEQVTIRVILRDAEDAGKRGRTSHPAHPQILWEDNPRIMAVA